MKYEYTSDLVELVKSNSDEIKILKDSSKKLGKKVFKLQRQREWILVNMSKTERYGEFFTRRITRFSTPAQRKKWDIENEIENLETEIRLNTDQITAYMDNTRFSVEDCVRSQDNDFDHLCDTLPTADKCFTLSKTYINMIDRTIDDINGIMRWLSYHHPRDDYRIDDSEEADDPITIQDIDDIEGEIYPPARDPTIFELPAKIGRVILNLDEISLEKEDLVNNIKEYEEMRYTKLDKGKRRMPIKNLEEIEIEVPVILRVIRNIPRIELPKLLFSLYQLGVVKRDLAYLRKPVSEINSQIVVDKKRYDKFYTRTIDSVLKEIMAV